MARPWETHRPGSTPLSRYSLIWRGRLERLATPFGYEIRPDQFPPAGTARDDHINVREQAQAENLKAHLDADRAMRVLVHVGFSHVNETSAGSPLHWFAGRLKQLTGEDPLTIDQVEGTPQYSAEHDALVYQAFLAQFGPPTQPMVIASDPATLLGNYRVDLTLIHPPESWVDGRPDWMAMKGYRKPHRVMLEPLGERSLVRAFVAGEPVRTIAMDQILVAPDTASVTLMLPAGDYRRVRQTEAGGDLALGSASID